MKEYVNKLNKQIKEGKVKYLNKRINKTINK